MAQDLARLRQALLEPRDDLLQPNDHDEETARYEAELEFFDCRTNKLRDELMRRIVQERCRSDYERPSNPISLNGIPARLYIAAERLFQQKVMTIQGVNTTSGKATVKIGLKNGSSKFLKTKGPREKYHVYAGNHPCQIELHHQSLPRGESAVRVGHKYASRVSAYPDKQGEKDTKGIVTALEEYLKDLEGDRQRFVESLQQMCATHIVQCKVLQNYDDGKKNKLLRIMFHILDNEPSQFLSACFTVGDDFKFGTTVSFARLVKLFHDGHITLKQIFLEDCHSDWNQIGSQGRCGKDHYALYSTLKVEEKKDKIRSTCQKIDDLYSEKYGLSLNKAQALRDLEFLYERWSVDELSAMLQRARLDAIDSIRELQQENASLKEKIDELETRLRQSTPEHPERAEAAETGDHTEYNIGGRRVLRADLDETKLDAHIKCVIKNVFTSEEMQNCNVARRRSGNTLLPAELLSQVKDHVVTEFKVPDKKKEEVEKKIEVRISKEFTKEKNRRLSAKKRGNADEVEVGSARGGWSGRESPVVGSPSTRLNVSDPWLVTEWLSELNL